MQARPPPVPHGSDPPPATDDVLAAALDRLMALAERQDSQIRALRALLDEML